MKRAVAFIKLLASNLLTTDGATENLREAFQTAVSRIKDDTLRLELQKGKYFKKLRKLMVKTPVAVDTSSDVHMTDVSDPEFAYNLYLANEDTTCPPEFNDSALSRCLLMKKVHTADVAYLQKLLQKCESSREQSDWVLKDLFQLATLTCHTNSSVVLEKTMQLYIGCLNEIYESKESAASMEKLKEETLRLLQMIHISYQSSDKKFEQMSYGDMLAALMSMYVDMVITCCRNKDGADEDGRKLSATVMMFFSGLSSKYLLDIILQQQEATSDDAPVFLPLCRSCLRDVQVESVTDYTRYICAVKQMSDLYKEQMADIVQKSDDVAAPSNYIEWLNRQDTNVVDDLPVTRHFKGVHITHFLLHEANPIVTEKLIRLLSDDGMVPEPVQSPVTVEKKLTDVADNQLYFIDREVLPPDVVDHTEEILKTIEIPQESPCASPRDEEDMEVTNEYSPPGLLEDENTTNLTDSGFESVHGSSKCYLEDKIATNLGSAKKRRMDSISPTDRKKKKKRGTEDNALSPLSVTGMPQVESERPSLTDDTSLMEPVESITDNESSPNSVTDKNIQEAVESNTDDDNLGQSVAANENMLQSAANDSTITECCKDNDQSVQLLSQYSPRADNSAEHLEDDSPYTALRSRHDRTSKVDHQQANMTSPLKVTSQLSKLTSSTQEKPKESKIANPLKETPRERKIASSSQENTNQNKLVSPSTETPRERKIVSPSRETLKQSTITSPSHVAMGQSKITSPLQVTPRQSKITSPSRETCKQSKITSPSHVTVGQSKITSPLQVTPRQSKITSPSRETCKQSKITSPSHVTTRQSKITSPLQETSKQSTIASSSQETPKQNKIASPSQKTPKRNKIASPSKETPKQSKSNLPSPSIKTPKLVTPSKETSKPSNSSPRTTRRQSKHTSPHETVEQQMVESLAVGSPKQSNRVTPSSKQKLSSVSPKTPKECPSLRTLRQSKLTDFTSLNTSADEMVVNSPTVKTPGSERRRSTRLQALTRSKSIGSPQSPR